nr:hypothetical transcript [Hymenolepis microstoma]
MRSFGGRIRNGFEMNVDINNLDLFLLSLLLSSSLNAVGPQSGAVTVPSLALVDLEKYVIYLPNIQKRGKEKERESH